MNVTAGAIYMVFKVMTGQDHHENEHGWRRQKDRELISKARQHHKLEEKRKSQRKETNKFICEVGGKAREHKVLESAKKKKIRKERAQLRPMLLLI